VRTLFSTGLSRGESAFSICFTTGNTTCDAIFGVQYIPQWEIAHLSLFSRLSLRRFNLELKTHDLQPPPSLIDLTPQEWNDCSVRPKQIAVQRPVNATRLARISLRHWVLRAWTVQRRAVLETWGIGIAPRLPAVRAVQERDFSEAVWGSFRCRASGALRRSRLQ